MLPDRVEIEMAFGQKNLKNEECGKTNTGGNGR